MNPTELLDEILRTNIVHDASGKEYPLDSNVDKNEGAFLQELIQKYKPQRTIEVGFAYGISSLYICSALQNIPGARHTIIDPGQGSCFNNVGIANLKRAGIDFFDFYEENSDIALPRMLSEGKNFDFGFIDGNHLFEYTLIDFFYINRMMKPGGIVVFDDTGFPAVNRAVRYVLNFPAYKYIGNVKGYSTAKREMFEKFFKTPLRAVANIFPHKLRHEIFSPTLIRSHKQLHLDTSMIALQKVQEDHRDWDWFADF